MKIIGLTAGASAVGSADILLNVALQAAEGTGAEVQLVRIDDLNLAAGPGNRADDSDWFWEQLLDSDGLIVSTPIYSRTIPGKLRLLGDKISGPQADVAFTSELLRMRAAGADIAIDFAIDERVLRPRVAGFIAVGGSIPDRWKTFALPLMHTLTASMHIAVVDQVVFAGAGSPSSIVLDDEALARAAALGAAVAGQAGREFDAVEYQGAPGACPLCHLDVIVLHTDHVECASCGARGRLLGSEVDWDGLEQSVLTFGEKLDHFHEVQETAARQAPLTDEIQRRRAAVRQYSPMVRPR